MSALLAAAYVPAYLAIRDSRVLPILAVCAGFAASVAIVRARVSNITHAAYLVSGLISLGMIGVTATVSGLTAILPSATVLLPALFVGLVLPPRNVVRASLLSFLGTTTVMWIDRTAAWNRFDVSVLPLLLGIVQLLVGGTIVLMVINLFRSLDRSIGQARESAGQLRLLYEASRLFGSATSLDALLPLVSANLTKILDASACFVILRDPISGELIPTAAWGVDEDSLRRMCLPPNEPSIARRVMERRIPIVIEDARNSAEVNPRAVAIAQARALIALPLIHRDETFGAIVITDARRPRHFTPNEIARVEGLVQQVAAEIATARAIERERRQAANLVILNRVSAAVATSLDPTEVCRLIVQEIGRATGYEHISLYLTDGQTLHLQAVMGYEAVIREMPIQRGILGKTVRSGRPILLSDVNLDPDYVAALPDVLSEACAPIRFGDEILGVINVETRAPRVLDAHDLNLLVAIAAQVAVALRNAQLFTQTRRHLNDLAFLYDMAGATAATLDFAQIMRLVAGGLMRSLEARKCSFSRWDRSADVVVSVGEYALDGDQVIIVSDELGETYRLDEYSVTRRVLEQQEVIQIQAGAPDAPPEEVALMQRLEHASLLMLPLVSPAGVFGLIEVYRVEAQPFHPDDASRSLAVAHLAATALERQRLFDAERRSRQVTESLLEVARALGSTLDLDALLNLILDQLRALIPYYSASIALRDEQTHYYRLRATNGLPGAPETFDAESALTVRVLLASRQPYRIDDTRAHPGWLRFESSAHIRSWMGVPLIQNDRVIGLLMLNHIRPGYFSEEYERLAEAFAQHAAIAIENARLLDQAHRQAARERLVRDINGKISASIQMDTVMQTAVDELGRALNASRCTIRLGADAAHMPVACAFCQPGVSPILPGSLEHSPRLIDALRERRTVIDSEPRLVGGVTVYTCLMTPIVVRGRVVGVLSLECDKPRQATPEDIAVIEGVGVQLGISIDNAQLYQEARHTLGNLGLLHHIAMTVASAASLDDAVSRVVESVHITLHHARVGLLLIDPATSDLIVRADVGAGSEAIGRHIPAGQGITGWVAQTGQTALVPDVRGDARYLDFSADGATRSELAVPLITDARVIGVLNLESAQADAFDETDVQLLSTLASNLAMIICNLQLLDEVRAANARLQEMDRLKSQFLANVSHELRTPLNSIIGFSEVLIDGLAGVLSADQLDFINSIHSSGQHLLTLINDVLDLSKIQAGRMKVDCRPTDLREVVDEACSVIAPLIIKAGQNLVRALEPDLPMVSADAFRFKQILINLLSNAHKFSPAGSRITLAARRVDGHVRFSVIDQGDGIQPGDHERVFQEFFQVDNDRLREREGTGLGLPITRRLVEMQGGRIWIESEGAPGQGAAFHFSLPVAEAVGAPPALPAIADTPQRRALIVEDDRHLSNLLAVYFSQQGYLPVQHYNGRSVVELARELRPAVITLDLMMPDRDGWSALRDLKSAPDTRDVPVIVISALDYTEIGLSQGAAEYLVKPFDPDQLLAALRRIGSAPRRDPLRVLVVDDDPQLNELLAVMLPQPDYAVVSATSGPEALDAIRRDPPDVVILDLLMPVMNGFELLELLRADPATHDLPVIVLTAKRLSEAERLHLDATAQTVLKKNDLTRQQLIGALRRLRLPARPEVEPQEVVA